MSARTIHPFPARMAPDVALRSIPSREAGKALVLDPMCGSGTVLSVAVEHGHDAIGFDVDPLAVLMSRVATTAIDAEEFRREAAQIASRARGLNDAPLPWRDPETQAFADYWFGSPQRHQLQALALLIGSARPSPVTDAMKVALSRTIVTKAPKASLAADTSHSRPHKVVQSSHYDVIDGFETFVASLAALLEKRVISGRATVKLGDCRTIHTALERRVDAAVTSPPYLNAIDYLRGHRLALIWLGFDIKQLREIRGQSIGAERGMKPSDGVPAAAILDKVLSNCLAPDKLPLAMLRRYVMDMLAFSSALSKSVRPGGLVTAVLGNSTVKGNYIKNDAIFREAMNSAGFRWRKRWQREIPPNRRYLPPSGQGESTLANRMSVEVIHQFELGS